MAHVLTFSTVFPAYHPKAGQKTNFPEKLLHSFFWLDRANYLPELRHYSYVEGGAIDRFAPKQHTIRAGKHWQAGEYFSPRIWSGKPYKSAQVALAPDIQLKRVADIEISADGGVTIDGQVYGHILMLGSLAKNDGLNPRDLADWFHKLPFSGQILIWDDRHLVY